MPESTPKPDTEALANEAAEAARAIVDVDGPGLPGEDFSATEAYLRDSGMLPDDALQPPGEPGDEGVEDGAADAETQQREADEDQLYLGRFKTVEDLERHAKHFQSEADRMRPDAELARKYPSFLEALESGDPQFKSHIKNYFEGGPPAEDGGYEPQLPPEDQPMTRRQFEALEREKDARRQQEEDTRAQLDELQESKGLTDEQLQAFVKEDLPTFRPTMLDLYRLVHLNDELKEVRGQGARDVVERTTRAARRSPAIGVAPGVKADKRTLQQKAAAEILAVDGPKSDVLADLGIG